jgi:hypothetical protein
MRSDPEAFEYDDEQIERPRSSFRASLNGTLRVCPAYDSPYRANEDRGRTHERGWRKVDAKEYKL